jgi:hypothetical protein
MVLTDAGWRVDTLVAKGWASAHADADDNYQCFSTDRFSEYRLSLIGGKMHPNQRNARATVSMILSSNCIW